MAVKTATTQTKPALCGLRVEIESAEADFVCVDAISIARSPDPQTSRSIMEMLTTILFYHFDGLSQAEVEKMLGLNIRLQDTRMYKDAKAEGKTEGKTEERRSVIFLLLDRKVGKLSARTKKKINALELPQLEALTIALLEFETIAELESWLSLQ